MKKTNSEFKKIKATHIIEGNFNKTTLDKNNIKEIILFEIRSDILKKKKDLTELQLNALVESIYEIALLKTKRNISMENINTYILMKNLVLSYDDNLKPIPFDFDLDLEFLSKIIYKYIKRFALL